MSAFVRFFFFKYSESSENYENFEIYENISVMLLSFLFVSVIPHTSFP